MKLSEVEVGKRYTAKVSGRLQVVRVTELHEIPPASWRNRGARLTLIYAVNESSGRRITIRSAQPLRSRVDGEPTAAESTRQQLLEAARALLEAREDQMVTSEEWDRLRMAVEAASAG